MQDVQDVILDAYPSIEYNKCSQKNQPYINLDSGKYDKNRVKKTISISKLTKIKVVVKDPVLQDETGDFVYLADIYFYDDNGLNNKPVLKDFHEAKYHIKSKDGVPEIDSCDVIEEITTAWEVAFANVLREISYYENATSTPVNQQSQEQIYPMVPLVDRVGEIDKTSSHFKTILYTLGVLVAINTVFIFILMIDNHNLKHADKPVYQQDSKTLMDNQPTATNNATSNNGLGLDANAFADVQGKTVTGMLKQMGIDPTHNQQDMGCLVN